MSKRNALRNILITFDFSSIAGRDQMAGVLRFLRERPNWTPRLISRAKEFTPEIVRNGKAENIDGIIINHLGAPGTAKALAALDIPLAVIGVRDPKLDARKRNIAFIRHDNEAIGRLAARHFLSLGDFRSFGFVSETPATEKWSQERERGFRAELAKRQRDVSTFQGRANAGTEESRQALGLWLKELPKPTAVFGAWDYPAVQVLESCRREGLSVPREIAVLGVDNDPMICESAAPPLASIASDRERQGYAAAAGLARIIETTTGEVRQPIIVTCRPTGVIERESAAPIAPAAQLVRRALRFIEQKACRGISTRDVAKALGVSQNLLSLRFHEFSDETVLGAIIRVRLEKVMTLLTTTQRKFTEIAKVSGFRNANYLKNLFRKRLGMSMRKYRATNQTTFTVTDPAHARSGKGGRAPRKRR